MNRWDVDDLDADEGQDDANEFLAELVELLEDDRFAFASDTITGIHDTVSRNGKVSEGQRRAIDNIKASVERGRR